MQFNETHHKIFKLTEKTFNHTGNTRHKAGKLNCLDAGSAFLISIIITHFATNTHQILPNKTFNFGVPSQKLAKDAMTFTVSILSITKYSLPINTSRSISVVLLFTKLFNLIELNLTFLSLNS